MPRKLKVLYRKPLANLFFHPTVWRYQADWSKRAYSLWQHSLIHQREY